MEEGKRGTGESFLGSMFSTETLNNDSCISMQRLRKAFRQKRHVTSKGDDD